MVGRMGHMAHGRRLSDRERGEIERRLAAGETQLEVAAAVGCDPRTIFRWIVRTGGLRQQERRRAARFLSLAEREEIVLGVAAGETAASIARRFGAICFNSDARAGAQRRPGALSRWACGGAGA